MIVAGAAFYGAAGAPLPDRLEKGCRFHSRIGVFGEVLERKREKGPRRLGAGGGGDARAIINNYEGAKFRWERLQVFGS
jgi:hypothetical protein